jgi:Mg2+ and Co2+ transporter CorA
VARLNLAIESVENTRELLVGSFDMFTTKTTLRTNEVIKVLALVSAVLFPASVVGVSGLPMRPPVDPRPGAGFWSMLGLIALVAAVTVAIAQWRKWI